MTTLSPERDPTLQDSLFGVGYADELARWFRKRLGVLCVFYAAWNLLGLAPLLLVAIVWAAPGGLPESSELRTAFVGLTSAWIMAADSAASIGIVVWTWVRGRRLASREALIGNAGSMILTLGIVSASASVAFRAFGQEERVLALSNLFFWHFTACMVLPWTWRESLRPMLPLAVLELALAAIAWGFTAHDSAAEGALDTSWRLLRSAMLLPAVVAPGCLLAWYRIRRHKSRFGRRRIGESFLALRQEVRQARQIHDALFPPAAPGAPIPYRYGYAPAREIGGDLAWTLDRGTDRLVVVVDVFGHGLAAALAVNRLHGEMERVLAEDWNATPAQLLTALDRYVKATLSRHGMFATAIAASLDARGRLSWANAGHPDGLVRRGATIEPLASTSAILGLGHPAVEGPAHELGEGGFVVLFTDGLTESTAPDRTQLGSDRVAAAVVAADDKDVTSGLVRLALDHARGVSGDDILVVQVGPVRRVEAAALNRPAEMVSA